MADIMFAGIGGQGVLTAGKVLIEIAAENGKNVSWTSEYSAEMRGGTALCRVVISDDEIGSPYPDFLDILCCMTKDAYDKYVTEMRANGTVVINSSLFEKTEFPENLQVYGVDTAKITAETGNARGANLVILGAMIKATEMLDKEQFENTLEEYFEKQGKNNPSNLECFRLGYEQAVRME
ncbi:MAG TPA: 2-oxoacid:acceptor oxidoreductase family protein [Candidatus Pelethocola excrementipullorum]|nr:2-oxoacid:acceptor oxidoreductase family protein [Candidatus Pelethocola excrementipullorum]